MAKPRLKRLTVEPMKNGGHTVRHEFESTPTFTKGMAGGLQMQAPKTEEHAFGPGDGQQLAKHLATALALKGLGQQASPAAQAQPPEAEQGV